VTNIVDDALTYITPGTDKAREIIGRAALDKVQQIVARLPAEMSKGLKDPAAFGALRNAIQKATTTSSNGVNMFNPAIFEKEATAMIGQLGNIFEKAEHQFLAASIGRLSKAMQSLPQGLSPAAAERVAAALTLARPKADAIMQAIETATNPSVKTMLIDALVDHGQAGLAALRRNLPTAAVAGTSSNVATEGAEDVAEVIGNRNAESR
jgi:hypothetical protein